MTLEEILHNYASCISDTQAALQTLAQESKANCAVLNTYNKEVSICLTKTLQEMTKLTAQVQVLREEVLELRKILDK